MRFLSIENVVPGSYLAKPLYATNGTILLRENFKITESILCRLKELGYTGLYIEDDISEGILIEDIIDEQLRLQAANRLEEIISKNELIAGIKPFISNIVDGVIENPDVVYNMNRLYGHHEYTYMHSVNVCILSVCIGVKLNLNHSSLIELGSAGILHDIGKKYVPIEILDKQGKLTKEEFELIQMHPEYGYRMLTESQIISSVTRAAVLQHHERFDGSGYPKGLKGKKITLFGRILAIADTYDAMTSDRAYRTAFLPSETIEYLMGDGNRLYDSQLIEYFLKCIAVYPLGSCVELSDGTIGIVIQNYSDCILRPQIRDIHNKTVIDLKNDCNYLNVCIVKTIT